MLRPPKKRALTPSTENDGILSNLSDLSPKLDSSIYKADLEHERALRALGAKRALQQQQRLEKLLKFSQDELEQCKTMLEEERQSSESHMDQLRVARDEAIQQLRELQQKSLRERHQHRRRHVEAEEFSSEREGHDEERGQQEALWERKYKLLETKFEAKTTESDLLSLQLRELRAELEEIVQEKRKAPTTPNASSSVAVGSSSSAPVDLLHELNRVRIELAESERTQRQVRRAAEDCQKKVKTLLPEREVARGLQIRVHKLEGQLKEIQKAFEETRMENQEWESFGKTLSRHFPNDREAAKSSSTPPEAAAILRHVEDSKKKLLLAEEENKALEQRLGKLKDWTRPADARMKSYDEQESAWSQERRGLQQQLESKQHQLDTIKKQEIIWKREIKGLKDLIQTFDNLPISDAAVPLAMASTITKLPRLELDLMSKQEELRAVKTDRDRIEQELAVVVHERQEERKDHARIKEKYGKLREALDFERGKAEEAGARALRAEELSGMGSFNPHETRVLQLVSEKSPLLGTLRQQNAILKKQLEDVLKRQPAEVSTCNTTVAVTPQLEVDPDKLHQRLKQSFKEQIGLFREGVYLCTGYKVDMLPG